HQQGMGRTGHRVVHAQAVEQGFPAGQGGQRQGGRVLVAQGPRRMRGDARIHGLQLGVGSGPVDLAGVVHAVAGLEPFDPAADRPHLADRVPAEDAVAAGLGLGRGADLHVHGVDRDGADFDQQVVFAVFRIRQLQVDQRARVGSGQGPGGADRFHGVLQAFWGGAQFRAYPVAMEVRTCRAHSVEEGTAMARTPHARFDCTAGCTVEATLELIGGKWKGVILYRLLEADVLRFNELRRMLPRITQRMLTNQLRELEGAGLVARTIYPEVPPRVEYRLSDYG